MTSWWARAAQEDRFIGGSGFDWAVFKDDPRGVDLILRAFDETPVPLSIAPSLSRFKSAEGLSGVGAQRLPARRRHRDRNCRLRRLGQRAREHRV